jgi:hypothetical protein
VNGVDRRSFGRMAALGAGIAMLAACGGSPAPATSTPPPAPTHELGPGKQIAAGDLDVGYVEASPVDGPPVISSTTLPH